MLTGKRVLVTGAGRGIGRAIAVICSDEGALVAITSRTLSELQETATQMTDQTHIVVADVTNGNEVHRMVDSVVQAFGGLDVLINNAGGPQAVKAPFDDLNPEDLIKLMTLNVLSVQIVSSAVVKHAMRENGHIINVSSRAGKIGIQNYSHYVSSKFALEGMSASMAADLKERNILVNTISPGAVNTKSFPKTEGQPGVRTPESIRDGLLILLKHRVTGCYLHVDELDLVRKKGLPDSAALKQIGERTFDPS